MAHLTVTLNEMPEPCSPMSEGRFYLERDGKSLADSVQNRDVI